MEPNLAIIIWAAAKHVIDVRTKLNNDHPVITGSNFPCHQDHLVVRKCDQYLTVGTRSTMKLFNCTLKNKVVKPHNGPSAVLVLITIGNHVVEDVIGSYSFGINE